jgi:hypothetical protein
MSFWGYWLLANCNNDLVINLTGHWLFPSEEKSMRKHAEKIGVTLTGEIKR